jgi:macrolide-specific efflux system membrane fusion protein
VKRVDVGAQVSGQVKAIHVALGQSVKRGELLVSLAPELALSDVAQAAAALGEQVAVLQSRKIELGLMRKEADRQKRLLLDSMTPSRDVERAEGAVAKLESDILGQTATVERLKAELDKRKMSLGYTRIEAPMDGTVVGIQVQQGQTVIATQVTPVLVTVADLATMTVRTKVAEADIQLVKKGQAAKFSTLSSDSKTYEGNIRVIQPVPEKAGHAVFYNVLFDIGNEDGALLSDMTVQVGIETGRASQVPTIPIVALGERDKEGRFTVQVLDSAYQARARQVKVGLQDGAKAQMLDGLKVGEKVLLVSPPPNAEANHSVTAR